VSACAVCGYETAEAFKFCPECGAEAAPKGQEQRKVVTVLFCDVVGSTALGESTDPEALRALLARYFDRMRAIVERHGGAVEKFIGDAVMAVFGVPLAHEDDGLRACRAAVEMREALPELGVEGRIGVMTGEVVTGTEERLATGDAVNIAARLQQAAQPGEVLLGEPTVELVRDAVAVEALEALELKGKAEPVPAFRLGSVRDAPARRHEARFVGRERELALIQQAWERALAEQGCELVTIVGEAGVGKSRLVAEALAPVDAPVVQGRCLPYGEGITYWPVVEVIKQLDALPSDPAAATAIRSLLRETEAGAAAEEIAWAFRKLLEERAPLVVVFDDIQWGEETFLDLVEHVGLLSSGSPLLLLCMARPELAERRAGWSVSLRLEPLPGDQVDELIGERVAPELRARIAHASGGNPLFISEILVMAAHADGALAVPPTLRALLAARLDQLEPAERRVLERGAVEGELFHRGAVQALSPEESQVTPRLAGLVRKELVRPDRSQLPGDDGFRFRHLLIRDAAYDGLPKSVRAELHERFAAWLEERGRELVELDEIVGYHLEQAYRYRRELGLDDESARELARSAAAKLASAARRALARSDIPAQANLLGRAVALLSPEEVPAEMLSELGTALTEVGELGRARTALVEAITAARASGDRRVELLAQLQRIYVDTSSDPSFSLAQAQKENREALAALEEVGDDASRARGWLLAGLYDFWEGRAADAEPAFERAFVHARRARDERKVADALWWLCGTLMFGPTPAAEGEQRCLQLVERAGGDPKLQVFSDAARASLVAMQGRFDEARALRDRAKAFFEELGLKHHLAATHQFGHVELLANAPESAEAEFRAMYLMSKQMGETGYLSTTASYLAQAVYAQGRYDEAFQLSVEAEQAAASDDVSAQSGWRSIRAKTLARRGDFAAAESLARTAEALIQPTDHLNSVADAMEDLAEVLTLAGRLDDACAALIRALALYERKGNLVMAERTRARLAERQLSENATRC
jgi:class 3 adenylate cyclase/tetratricopeptide (TPR) repeat protein